MRLDAAQRRALLAHPGGWIACGFGSGLSPRAPGTAGSAAALLPWLALRELDAPYYVLVVAIAFAIGAWASNVAIDRLRIADPGAVVCDEFVGQWIALLPLVLAPRGWPWVAVAFGLFRLFDVWKPWPVSWADRRIHGGVGVMLDDVIAGAYAALVLALVLHVA
ncbi:phosphatidylglycerophosphatase A [Dokdonella fugitiva]|uniref:Phosphatidylglycerophosphatase A n=1 Tax=Dokdonella fugitiva TaxID=328517 RepID=A0A839F0G1_9GAMM|nr:phosphatidylglycerophosphatase A [Dokdonella fugitiva]MBA8888423.1 phosphatidylglycerophosphatase A [Dokdonella fugitiva]